MKKAISESDVEENALNILESLDYEIIRGDSEYYLPDRNNYYVDLRPKHE